MKINTDHPAYVLVFVLAVSAVFTAAIMTLDVLTRERVDRNERLRLEKALVELFELGDPGKMTAEEIHRTVAQRIRRGTTLTDPRTGEDIEIIHAYDRERTDPAAEVVGVALPVSGMGFWAPIRGLLAVTPDLSEATGVVFLSHSETPGLGARIEEKSFRRQFKGLNVAPPEAGGQYIHVGRGKPFGEVDPKARRDVDAITGATQTSRAVDRFINESIRRFRRAYVAAQEQPASQTGPGS